MGPIWRKIRAWAGSEAPASGWEAEIGWRYIAYIEERGSLVFQIEPMAKGPDLVYVPGEEPWRANAPVWACARRLEILARIKSVEWNRKLVWSEGDDWCVSDGPAEPVPGSLESTEGGRRMENERLFAPGGELTHEQAHEIWHVLARRFAQSARGPVTIFASTVVPDSVFQVIELPELRSNPNVKLDFQ